MTNLEYYQEELKDLIRTAKREHGNKANVEDIADAFEMFFLEHIDFILKKVNPIDWLLSEHKEPPIKLTKFEYDLVASCDFIDKYKAPTLLAVMKRKGYFSGVADESMSAKEILENCTIES